MNVSNTWIDLSTVISQNELYRPVLAEFFKFQTRAGPTPKCLLLCNIFALSSPSRGGMNHEQRKGLTGSPGQPWQLTGPRSIRQAKFGQYLQAAHVNISNRKGCRVGASFIL